MDAHPHAQSSADETPQLLPALSTIEHLLSRGVRPDAPALIDPEERLSFAEFTDAVSRMAGLLLQLGVQRGDRVALHLRKSVHSFVAVHAVLRAGAIMVPLDPLAPPDHGHSVLLDAEPTTLVTDAGEKVLDGLLRGTAIRCVVTRSGRETPRPVGVGVVDWSSARDADTAPPPSGDSDDPAYIIYTSGSTGVPKGILHTHRSGIAYAERAAGTYGLTPADRLANVASLHFDQSTFELYAAPLAGASVVVVPEPFLRFPANTSELLEREEATVWYSVPYILRQLAERGALDRRDLSRLRWILFGGETYPAAELRALMHLIPSARVSNVYGPAEVNQCTHRHLDAPPADDRPIPIGRPWEDTEVAVVGPELQRVDDGDAGELLVATPTMMAGYWRRPDLTSSSIVDFEGRSGWYRTGDHVRTVAGGDLTFLGRADNQVKIRGHRVEIEAVEAALLGLEPIHDCGVGVDPSSAEPRLVAAVVSDPPVREREVQRELAGLLPAAAVPASIVELDEIPRAPGGKIDRQELLRRLDQTVTPTPVEADR